MIASRRGFLRSLGSGVTFGAAARFPFIGLSTAAIPEPVPSAHEDALICLNNNENAYGPSNSVTSAIQSFAASVNRYPFKEDVALAQRIADQHRVKSEQILLGCGSTDI